MLVKVKFDGAEGDRPGAQRRELPRCIEILPSCGP